MTKLLLSPLFAAAALAATAQVPVDFDKIEHWSGEGPNRAALVISNEAGAQDPYCYVWGYRWTDDAKPTGEDMFKAVCADSPELVLLTQYTGSMGATVCGIGFGDATRLLQNIYFDFEMAREFEFINFDYFNTNTLYGQKEAPGENTPEICQAAIDAAASTHVIQHPLDYKAYGYPAYDYDCWKFNAPADFEGWWASAWYCGYWSYWTAAEKAADWMYSGSGFSGRQLFDGAIDAWIFTPFDDPKVGGFGEGLPPASQAAYYNYRPRNASSGCTEIPAADTTPPVYYTLQGICLGNTQPAENGIYIVRHGNKTSKILISNR